MVGSSALTTVGARFKGLALKPFALGSKEITVLHRERWSPALLREYVRALRYKRDIQTRRVRRVFVFSYSRSGTHNFVSRLHYVRCCFAVRENLFSRPRDRFQLRINAESIRPLHFMGFSMFGVHGLQEKLGHELSHLIFMNNHYFRYRDPLNAALLRDTDYVVYYLRNFLRVLYSMDQGARKDLRRGGKRALRKLRFVVTDRNFRDLLQLHRDRVKEMLQLVDQRPGSVRFCFHERFCAEPGRVLGDLLELLQIDGDLLNGWDAPEKFFTRCFGSGTRPIIRTGKLWCDSRRDN